MARSSARRLTSRVLARTTLRSWPDHRSLRIRRRRARSERAVVQPRAVRRQRRRGRRRTARSLHLNADLQCALRRACMAGVEASDQRLCVHSGDRHSGNDPARQLGSMAITPTGVPGIRIGLTAPGSAPGQRGGYPRVHLGKAIIIRGRTDPPSSTPPSTSSFAATRPATPRSGPPGSERPSLTGTATSTPPGPRPRPAPTTSPPDCRTHPRHSSLTPAAT
jgi:hypothetical protein